MNKGGYYHYTFTVSRSTFYILEIRVSLHHICTDVFRVCVWSAHESAKIYLRNSAKVSEKFLRVCVCDAHIFGPCALHINICAFMPSTQSSLLFLHYNLLLGSPSRFQSSASAFPGSFTLITVCRRHKNTCDFFLLDNTNVFFSFFVYDWLPLVMVEIPSFLAPFRFTPMVTISPHTYFFTIGRNP